MKKHILATIVLGMTLCMCQAVSAEAGALASSRSASSEEEGRGVRVVAVPVAPLVVSTLAPTDPSTLSFPYVPRTITLPPYTTWTSPEEFEKYLEAQMVAKPSERIMFQNIPQVVRAYYQTVLEDYKNHALKEDPTGSEMIRYIAKISHDESDLKRIQEFMRGKEDFHLPGDLQRYMFNTESYTPLSELYETLKQAKQARDE